MITDISLQIIFFNEHAEKIYHINAEDIIGQHVNALKPNLNLEIMIKNQQQLVKDKDFINGDEVVIERFAGISLGEILSRTGFHRYLIHTALWKPC